MVNRDFLELVASAININEANYPNDSALEQKVIYELTNMTAKAGTATTLAPSTRAKSRVSGGKNV